MTKTEIYHNT